MTTKKKQWERPQLRSEEIHETLVKPACSYKPQSGGRPQPGRKPGPAFS